MDDRRPSIDFDHNSAQFADDPIGRLGEVRRRCPVAWSTNHDGYWVLTGYDAVATAARDHAVFSSARSQHGGEGLSLTIPKRPGAGLIVPEEMDPPEGLQYRRLFNTLLSPGSVERMRPAVTRWVTHFLDQVIEQGRCDLVLDFASPVPASVTLEWLGFPLEHLQRVAETMHDIAGCPPGSERFLRAAEGMGWLEGLIDEVIAARRSRPEDDVVSWMIEQEIDGAPITDDRLHSMLRLAIAGGVDTTASATSQAFVHLARHPSDRSRLLAEPELVPSAVEEFLRFYPPTMGHARTVRQDVVLGGCPISAGDRVYLSWASANRDELEFPDADSLKLDRVPNRHVSFGLGVHRCVGSHLARAMFREMLTQVLERIPDYAVDETGLQRYPSAGVISGWTSVPVTFTPGARR